MPPLQEREQLDRLAITPDGQLFARSSQATYRLAPGGTAFQRLADVPRAETLFGRMHVDAEGGVWLPTEKGMVRHHAGQLQCDGLLRGEQDARGDWQFARETLPQGQPRERIADLTLDRRGGLWAAGSDGLVWRSGGQWRRFGTADGLHARNLRDELWLAYADRSGELARVSSAPDQPARLLQALVTPHHQNTLQLRFSALSYTDQSGVHYQARLQGLNGDWYDSPTREARYAGLAPGEYRLQLLARYRDGPWGPVTELPLTVRPAWWQTTSFKLSVAGALALLLWGLERRRVARHRTQTAQLEALVVSRTQELAVANEQLRLQSLTDPLTQLHNRRYLHEVMAQQVALVDRELRGRVLRQARLSQPGEGLALVMVDLDHFKSVNDQHGRAAGDLVLQQVAALLRDCTRESDTVARWGGEEFAVVGRQASPQDAVTLVERIRSRVEAHAFHLDDGTVLRRTCSIGFAVYPFIAAEPQRLAWETLFQLADRCLYVAKRNGRNRAVGVQPRLARLQEAADVEALCQCLDDELAALVAEGWLEVLGERAGEPPLDWREG